MSNYYMDGLMPLLRIRKKCIFFCLAALSAGAVSCLKETELPVHASFEHQIEGENQTTPVVISVTNTTTGADFYEWTFEGGSPAYSAEKTPEKITFSEPGEHLILLRAWNDTKEDIYRMTLRVDSAVTAGFDCEILMNDFAPVEVNITNTTRGASSYEWTFEGAETEHSTEAQPGIIRFAEGGTFKLSLKAYNGSEYFLAEKMITLQPTMKAEFSAVPVLADEDMQAPVTMIVKNLSRSSISHIWQCDGGQIADETADETTIRFTAPGTYTISLTTDNLKERQTVALQITVKENAGLHIFRDVHFGINEAKNTVGCFFAADEKRVLLSKEIVDAGIGKSIDIGFFALNSDFDYCYFFSPDKARESAFPSIPGAIRTAVQNLPKGGNTLTADAFGRIEKSEDMDIYSFAEGSSSDYFGMDALPLFVYFRTEDGRRGIIHLKEAVRKEAQSYIVADIKMEKRPEE